MKRRWLRAFGSALLGSGLLLTAPVYAQGLAILNAGGTANTAKNAGTWQLQGLIGSPLGDTPTVYAFLTYNQGGHELFCRFLPTAVTASDQLQLFIEGCEDAPSGALVVQAPNAGVTFQFSTSPDGTRNLTAEGAALNVYPATPLAQFDGAGQIVR